MVRFNRAVFGHEAAGLLHSKTLTVMGDALRETASASISLYQHWQISPVALWKAESETLAVFLIYPSP